MIKIKLKNAAEIEDWYAEQVTDIIKDKIANYSSDITSIYAHKIITQLDDHAIRDLLTMPISGLIEKHTWAKAYYEVACFVSEFSDLHEYLKELYQIRGYAHHKCVAEYQREREEYLNKYKGNNFIDVMKNQFHSPCSAPDSVICQNNKNMEEFISSVSEEFDKVNDDLSKIINYDFLDEDTGSGKKDKSSIRAEYVKRLGIRVCPYCNQQYIYYFGDSRYLGDLDHIRPKSKFALFSMSMYNLVPACKPCNQLFKRSSTKQILNPYEEGFSNDAYLHLNYKNVRELVGIDPVTDMEWRVNKGLNRYPDKQKNEVISQNIDNAIKLFELDEVYKGHADEIQLALKRRFYYDWKYRNIVKSLVGTSSLITPKLFYGVSFDEEKYQDELMSKAIDDVVWRN
ncbi:hypothetical protein SAMN02745229_01188 [Butyrivibrio fibrisolvens DSM 3071]|uniref:HNH nuclease domain-containing protein n=1 Tax=Butyrivibrio fibrisolvens DSM 3071 TaxID=1121131 RepID=A0A1M5WYS2_BUTFI|nr:HNH endonuclease [Butyrivibrio fibrisolvens]SHH92661.1 hypothetical protein SAMN02745229_01188 [Butyrivibrio fibrisolvens DSM 3071]